jgi:hypothetical protein
MRDNSFILFSSLLQYFAEKKFVLLTGKRALESHHVREHRISSNNCDVEAVVMQSYETRAYKVTMTVQKQKIIRHTCECPMGEFFCHHAAALAHHLHKNVSCTDIAAYWKMPGSVKDSTDPRVSKMFPNNNHAKLGISKLLTKVNENELKSIQDSLLASGFPAYMQVGLFVCDEPQPENDNSSSNNKSIGIEMLLKKFKIPENFHELFKSLSDFNTCLENGEINVIAELTKGQGADGVDSVSSFVRKKKFTASNFHYYLICLDKEMAEIATTTQKKYLGSENANYGSVPSLSHGRSGEPKARKMYEDKFLESGFRVEETGFVFHPSKRLGASPDGIIRPLSRLIEIKCPYAAKFPKDSGVLEWMRRDWEKPKSTTSTGCYFSIPKNFDFSKLEEEAKQNPGKLILLPEEIKLKNGGQAKIYHHQIQGTLYITGMTHCDLIVWSAQSTVVKRIYRDIKWAENIPRLIALHEKFSSAFD